MPAFAEAGHDRRGGSQVFLMPLFFVAAIALVVWAAMQPAGGFGFDDAREIARRRLASGEINESEYQRIASQLGDRRAVGQRWVVFLLAGVLAASAVTMICWMAWADDWGWGWGGMSDMMRWRRSDR
jgi:hypothetical protein